MPAVSGTEPTAIRAWLPETLRPSVSSTPTLVAIALDRRRAGAVQHLDAAPAENVFEHGGSVSILTGQHPIARGDQGDLRAQRPVGRSELRAGDT